MKMYITLSVLLISLVAVGAYAQTEGDPVKEKEQVQEQNQLQTRQNRDGMEDDKALDGECDGDQTRTRELNYGSGDGDNNELGENRRHGDENTGEGGPHGPMDSGSLDDLFKILGDDADGTFAGDMLQHRWGPGSSDGDSPFGPNVDHVGHGQRNKVSGDSDDPTRSARGQARAGRR